MTLQDLKNNREEIIENYYGRNGVASLLKQYMTSMVVFVQNDGDSFEDWTDLANQIFNKRFEGKKESALERFAAGQNVRDLNEDVAMLKVGKFRNPLTREFN